MKIFIYKSIFICFLLVIVFHLTFGFFINYYKKEFFNTFSKDKILFLKNKLREEVEKSNQKEKILYPEDAEVFGKFIRKILLEIKQ